MQAGFCRCVAFSLIASFFFVVTVLWGWTSLQYSNGLQQPEVGGRSKYAEARRKRQAFSQSRPRNGTINWEPVYGNHSRTISPTHARPSENNDELHSSHQRQRLLRRKQENYPNYLQEHKRRASFRDQNGNDRQKSSIGKSLFEEATETNWDNHFQQREDRSKGEQERPGDDVDWDKGRDTSAKDYGDHRNWGSSRHDPHSQHHDRPKDCCVDQVKTLKKCIKKLARWYINGNHYAIRPTLSPPDSSEGNENELTVEQCQKVLCMRDPKPRPPKQCTTRTTEAPANSTTPYTKTIPTTQSTITTATSPSTTIATPSTTTTSPDTTATTPSTSTTTPSTTATSPDTTTTTPSTTTTSPDTTATTPSTTTKTPSTTTTSPDTTATTPSTTTKTPSTTATSPDTTTTTGYTTPETSKLTKETTTPETSKLTKETTTPETSKLTTKQITTQCIRGPGKPCKDGD